MTHEQAAEHLRAIMHRYATAGARNSYGATRSITLDNFELSALALAVSVLSAAQQAENEK